MSVVRLDIRKSIPQARFVIEGTNNDAPLSCAEHLVEAVGRDGARVWVHSQDLFAVLLKIPAVSRRAFRALEGVLHQEGDFEGVKLVGPGQLLAALKLAGVPTKNSGFRKTEAAFKRQEKEDLETQIDFEEEQVEVEA